MIYSKYEEILRTSKKVDWYDTEVPQDLLTLSVKTLADQIIDQINKYEGGVDGKKKKPYILNLWANVRNLPYVVNGDGYLKRKEEIEKKIESERKTKPKPTSERIIEIEGKVTKNSQLIFGSKN